MITKSFWALLILDTVALAVLAFLVSRGPSSPEGPVGAWLIAMPPFVMIVLAALVLITKSEGVKIAGICLLGFPWVSVVVGPIYSALQNYQVERSIAGDNDFRKEPQRKLAHAMTARDAALAKTLIPLAGDLNRQYGEETLLHFAVANAHDLTQLDAPVPTASLDIVKALLEAGAKADHPAAYNRWPLSSAMYAGPELTEMLLRAGANPNHLDDAERPLWWQVLSDDTDRGLRTLAILLDHGADLTKRDREGGPVGWAAYHAQHKYHASWRAVWLLIERGATWKGEQAFGQSVATMLARDFEERERSKSEISEAMRKLRAKYANE
jgi:hypothetical protein